MNKVFIFILATIFLSPCSITATELHDACRRGNLEEVEKLINSGANVRDTDSGGCTPLHVAAYKHYEEVVSLLINSKANVNATDNNGSTPLHMAVNNRHKKIVKLLLASGAEVGAQRSNGQTPLHIAAYNGDKKVVKLLLDSGGEVDATQDDGSTPLHMAASEGHEEMVKLLLGSGADLNTKNIFGSTPLYWAAEIGHEGVVKQLTTAPLLLKQSNSVNSSLSKEALNELDVYCVGYGRDMLNYFKYLPVPAIESVIDNIFPIKDDIESRYIKAFLKSCSQDLKDNPGQSAFASLFIREFYREHLLKLKLYIAIKNNDGRAALSRAKTFNKKNIVTYLEKIENAKNYDALNKDLREQTESNYQLAVGYEELIAEPMEIEYNG